MRLVPLTQRAAKAWVDEVHRHLKAPRGDVIRVGVEYEGLLVGVAMAGRPAAYMLDDGITLEVTRVAVLDGAPRNACSMLYGALRRAARALGYQRMITYTLESEGGASLRGAGWVEDGPAGGGEWSRPSRARKPAKQPGPKVRWRIDLAPGGHP